MPKRALSSTQVSALRAPGNHWVAPSLYLQVRDQGTRSWLFRYERDGKTRWLGLGPAAGIGPVSLTDARHEAERLRVAVRDGADPVSDRRAKRTETRKDIPTFAWCCRQYVAAHEASWTNEKHRFEWGSSLKRYAEPIMGKTPVDAITVDDVHRVLEPIWVQKPETASRLRGRIESVLGWAAAKGFREGDNPARWQGGALAHLLPAHGRIQKVVPRKATPYAEVPALVARIKSLSSTSAHALLFTLLTAARSIEALGARWDEIDLDVGTWTVPAARMKMKKEHRVALSKQAVELLRSLPRKGDLVFPAQGGGQLSGMAMLMCLRGIRPDTGETVHGLRSSFATWAAQETEHLRELVEASLAHATGDPVALAYQRGDYLERRRAVSQEWADYAYGGSS